MGFELTPVTNDALTIVPVHQEKLKLAVPDYHPHVVSGEGRKSTPLSAFATDHFIIPPRNQFPSVYDENHTGM